MTSLYERLSALIRQEVDGNYVDEDIIPLVSPRAEQTGDISVSQIVHKQLKDLPEAALTAAGFNPSEGTLFAEEYAHKVFTASERIRMNERDWAFVEKHGIAGVGIGELGKKVGKAASKFFMIGQDGAGTAVEGNTNYLTHAGAGTLVSPSIITQATAGAWATWSNQNTDITRIVAQLEENNYNLAATICLYPKAASSSMRRHGANTLEHSAIEHLIGMGIPCIAVPNAYLYTAAGATPVVGAFDLYLVDTSKLMTIYSRPQRTQVFTPHDEQRDTVIDCEVWFVPWFTPQPFADGTIKKGVSRITAINGA